MLNEQNLNSNKSRAVSASLATMLFVAGIAVCFVSPKILHLFQCIVFIAISLLGMALIIKYMVKKSEKKSIWELVSGLFNMAIGLTVFFIWIFNSSISAKDVMTIILSILFSVLAFLDAFSTLSIIKKFKSKELRLIKYLNVSCVIYIILGLFLILYPFIFNASLTIILSVYLTSSGIAKFISVLSE